MGLKDTIDLMTSDCREERFEAELYQLKIRIKELEKILDDYLNRTLIFEPKIDYGLLKAQLMAMQTYKYILLQRATNENIELRYEWYE